ncbi:MAG: RdgB/HAM1 family non-canonical purine NTP pyrophosphatase [Saprospiraceae bacterium]|jgi:XTP/dITP diphosphohydrolase|nr:RdgB/HAM1 family non-canonical purine NTP pyrophosphatase [Saprospiraceae bacterium]
MNRIIFATQNQHKVKEISSILHPGINSVSLADLGFLEELLETGSTLTENAIQKAEQVWDSFKLPCISEDTGLFVKALNGAPGVFTARFAQRENSSLSNNDLLLEKLLDHNDRSAYFETCICYKDTAQTKLFYGRLDGTISIGAKGLQGFGYDPIFIPDTYIQTLAEIDLDKKSEMSHRSLAFKSFEKWFLAQFF